MAIKKILLASAAFTILSIAIILFQMTSCRKAFSQTGGSTYTLPPATTSTLGGVIVGKGLNITGTGIISVNNDSSKNYSLPAATATSLGGIIVGNGLSISSNGTVSVNTSNIATAPINKIVCTLENNGIWIVNYDGTNAQKINITLPSGFSFSEDSGGKLSPDGQYVFFGVQDNNLYHYIYSCKIDGTNLRQVIKNTNGYVTLGGAY